MLQASTALASCSPINRMRVELTLLLVEIDWHPSNGYRSSSPSPPCSNSKYFPNRLRSTQNCVAALRHTNS